MRERKLKLKPKKHEREGTLAERKLAVSYSQNFVSNKLCERSNFVSTSCYRRKSIMLRKKEKEEEREGSWLIHRN